MTGRWWGRAWRCTTHRPTRGDWSVTWTCVAETQVSTPAPWSRAVFAWTVFYSPSCSPSSRRLRHQRAAVRDRRRRRLLQPVLGGVLQPGRGQVEPHSHKYEQRSQLRRWVPPPPPPPPDGPSLPPILWFSSLLQEWRWLTSRYNLRLHTAAAAAAAVRVQRLGLRRSSAGKQNLAQSRSGRWTRTLLLVSSRCFSGTRLHWKRSGNHWSGWRTPEELAFVGSVFSNAERVNSGCISCDKLKRCEESPKGAGDGVYSPSSGGIRPPSWRLCTLTQQFIFKAFHFWWLKVRRRRRHPPPLLLPPAAIFVVVALVLHWWRLALTDSDALVLICLGPSAGVRHTAALLSVWSTV